MELTSYLNEIGRLPVLSKEAQLLHCRRIHAWVNHPDGKDNAPRKVARSGRHSMDVMIQTNQRLVVSVARKYVGRGLDMADLIQEGTLGLIRGLELFDPTRGYTISTYAYWWIRQSINRALHTQARIIRLPINTHELLTQVTNHINTFATKHGRNPTPTEIGEALGHSADKIRALLDAAVLTSCCSLDAQVMIRDDTGTVQALIANPEETASNTPELALAITTESEFIQQALSRLPEDEATVLRALYLDEKSMTKVADELGSTRAKIQQIRNTALLRLKFYMRRSRYR